MTKTEILADAIVKYLKEEKKNGKTEISLTAGEVGKMFELKNRTPMCVDAMKLATEKFKGELIHDVPSGQSTTVEIKYYL